MSNPIDRDKIVYSWIVGSDGEWHDGVTLQSIIRKMPTLDAVEVVRCKDCKHRPIDTGGHNYGQDMEFPDEVCPCLVGDNWYSWMPKDDWFCANGERKETEDAVH